LIDVITGQRNFSPVQFLHCPGFAPVKPFPFRADFVCPLFLISTFCSGMAAFRRFVCPGFRSPRTSVFPTVPSIRIGSFGVPDILPGFFLLLCLTPGLCHVSFFAEESFFGDGSRFSGRCVHLRVENAFLVFVNAYTTLKSFAPSGQTTPQNNEQKKCRPQQTTGRSMSRS
jgi:hypothetical protein